MESHTETIIRLQDRHAYWYRMANDVRKWLESHPDNAAGKYDMVVYQNRAREDYNHIQVLKDWCIIEA